MNSLDRMGEGAGKNSLIYLECNTVTPGFVAENNDE